MQLPYSVGLSEHGSRMRDAHSTMSAANFEAASRELTDILEAYRLVIEIIASAASRTQGTYQRSSADTAQIEGVLSVFIAGLTLVEYAILSGYTAQAAALVRQELEAVAALEEIKVGRRIDGKTPNIRHLPNIPGHVYSELSELTHFSRSSALRLVGQYRSEDPDAPENTEQWLLSPQHVPNTTKQLFALHTVLLLHFALHQSAHYASLQGTMPAAQDAPEFQQAVTILKRAGVIENDA